jgi:Family of unknown function (DUF6049)
VHGLVPADITRRVLSLAAAIAMPAAITAALALAAPAQASTTQTSTTQTSTTQTSTVQASTARTNTAQGGAAGASTTEASTAQAGRAGQVSVAIDSMSPQTARPGATVTVTGTVTNDTSQTEAGLNVALLTSPVRFQTRDAMDAYASHGTGASLEQAGSTFFISASLKPGTTAGWRASFQVNAAGMTEFGVYPVTAQLADVNGDVLASSQTLLPFWPGEQESGLLRPLDIGWTWPLIDQPHHQVCTALTNNDLTTSLGTGGRLSDLLAAGEKYPAADLTWVIDPALLSDAETMTRTYQVDSGSGCSGAVTEPASSAAQKWISVLSGVTSAQPAVIAPYANVDVSALVHSGLTGNIATAYTMGDQVADSVLHGSFGPSIAVPPGGTADLSVLTDLATAQHIGAVVLNSSEMPVNPSVFEPDDAVTSVRTGDGLSMTVLLADNELSGVLAAGDTSSGALAAGTQFSVSQRFLAETAMIAAEAPDSDRSIVVAPPEDWSPSVSLASELLSETTSTPWLAPTTLSSLASARDSERTVTRQSPPASKDSPGELSASYLSKINAVGIKLAAYADSLYQPSGAYLQGLNQALIATESSAWRGRGQAQGLALAYKLSSFMSGEESRISIITAQQVPMGGSSGPVPVSVRNGSHHAIQVRLNVSVVNVPNRATQLTVGHFQSLITVQPQQEQNVRLPVSSAPIGPTAIRLSLSTPNGARLALSPTSFTVQSTRDGRTILFLIVAAVGVLVLTSLFRGIRRRRRGDGQSATEDTEPPGSVVKGTSSARHPTEARD